jgi:FixJ family two-component response regulator
VQQRIMANTLITRAEALADGPKKSSHNKKPDQSMLASSPEKKPAVLMAIDKDSLIICLLDDDESMLKSVHRLLAGEGWRVKSFLDPREFLAYAETNQPRVAVIDIYMPVMDGLEVQRRLRDLSPSSRVIILTSKDDPSIRTRALSGGASGFFVKPAPDDAFLAGVESAAA